MIRFEDVSFAYPGSASARPAISHLSFSLERGQMLAVLGSNGSGKSTLARLSNGLLTPSAGRVTVDGLDTAEGGHAYDIRASVGMVFQHPDDQIVATSVEDDIAFGPENLGLPRDEIRRRVDEAIDSVGLRGLEGREPHLLSGGQKQRLAIAGALAMEPSYLVLDEPTSMIDPQGRRDFGEVLTRLRAAGHGILLVTHDVADALNADDVLVLARGESAFRGTAQGLLADSRNLFEWGLEPPQLILLAQALRTAGVPVPDSAADLDGVVGALWR